MAAPTVTLTYQVDRLDRILATGAVTEVRWTLVGTDGTYTKSIPFRVELDQPEDPADLTPYSDLTAEWAVNAVKAKIGADQVTSIESQLTAIVREMAAPTMGSGLPWVES
jgi:uncharacterized lipoprotein YmbA